MSFVHTDIFSVYHMSLLKLILEMVPMIPNDIEISPCRNLRGNQMYLKYLFIPTKHRSAYDTEGGLAKMVKCQFCSCIYYVVIEPAIIYPVMLSDGRSKGIATFQKSSKLSGGADPRY